MSTNDEIIANIETLLEQLVENNEASSILGLTVSRLMSPFSIVLNSTDHNNLKSYVNNISNYIKSNQTTNIQGQLVAIINIINKIPSLSDTEQNNDINLLLSQLRGEKKKLDKINSSFISDIKSLEARLSTLENNANTIITKLSQVEQQQSTAFTNKQNERDTLFTNAQNKQTSEFAALLTKLKTDNDARLNQEHDKIAKQYNELDKSYANKYQQEFDLITNKHSDLLSAANTLQAEMNTILEKTKELYGWTGEVIVAGTEKKYADACDKNANRFFWVAIALMVIAAGVLIYPIFSDFTNFEWANLLHRIPVTTICFIPAIYIASEANRFRKKAHYYRDIEVKLRAINPYMREIENGKTDALPYKDHVKLELIKELMIDKYKDDGDETVKISLLTEILKLIKK
jgi:hypothetical protein